MAKVYAPFDIVGRMGDYVIYRLPGVDKPVMRLIGKTPEATLKKRPRIGENRVEFGGRSTASRWIRTALMGQTAITKFTCASTLHTPLRQMQLMDKVSRRGQLAMLFSKGASLLNGFCLTPSTRFDSIIRNPVRSVMVKDSLSAQVSIPALIPGVNFSPRNNDGMYQLVATLGVVPDLHYNGEKYAPRQEYRMHEPVSHAETAWYPVRNGSPDIQLTLQVANRPPDTSYALLLSVGIQFGTMIGAGNVVSSDTPGAAIILSME